jgi:hypothetical protein
MPLWLGCLIIIESIIDLTLQPVIIPSVIIGAMAPMMTRVKTCFNPRLKLLILIGAMAPTGMGT